MVGKNNIFDIRTFIVTILVILILILFNKIFHVIHIPPHIKDIAWALFAIAAVVLALYYFTEKDKKNLDREHLQEEYFTEKKSKSKKKKGKKKDDLAIVMEFESNRIGDIDKIKVKRNDKSDLWLHFPPHTASQVKRIITIGDKILYESRKTHKNNFRNQPMENLEELENVTTNIQLNIDIIPPPHPTDGIEVTLEGRIQKFKLDEKGEISGFILEGHIVDIPPHLAKNIAPLLKEAEKIALKGYLRPNTAGFINITGLPFIKPFTIKINDTDYLL